MQVTAGGVLVGGIAMAGIPRVLSSIAIALRAISQIGIGCNQDFNVLSAFFE